MNINHPYHSFSKLISQSHDIHLNACDRSIDRIKLYEIDTRTQNINHLPKSYHRNPSADSVFHSRSVLPPEDRNQANPPPVVADP